MSNTNTGMDFKLSQYIASVSLREPTILRQLREETAQLPECNMQIAPEQGQFMGLLAQLTRAEKVLEIGVFTGYSSLAVALSLPTNGRITALDVSDEWTAVARRYWRLAGLEKKVDLHLGPALVSLEKLLQTEAETYDLAFIDADKVNYDAYYESSLRLLKPGGLLMIDNVLWDGKVLDEASTDPNTLALQKLNQKIHGDERVSLSLVPIADGLTLALKR